MPLRQYTVHLSNTLSFSFLNNPDIQQCFIVYLKYLWFKTWMFLNDFFTSHFRLVLMILNIHGRFHWHRIYLLSQLAMHYPLKSSGNVMIMHWLSMILLRHCWQTVLLSNVKAWREQTGFTTLFSFPTVSFNWNILTDCMMLNFFCKANTAVSLWFARACKMWVINCRERALM